MSVSATASRTQEQPPPLILDLRNRSNSPLSSPSEAGSIETVPPVDPLREQLISGLKGTELVIPGRTDADRQFGYTKRVSTMFLYGEKGLSIYEDITKTKAYYPFEAEKEILETYGDEIACRMFGLPSSALEEEQADEGNEVFEATGSGNSAAKKEKWGDPSVGLHNYGVNGGLNHSKPIHPTTVGLAVELGSGSLDKTRHLLRSMAKLLQPKNKTSTPGIMKAIEYKALDLEAASLYSTLTSLASVEGDCVTTSLQDHIPTRRVSVSGLHATYDEGLAFLKEQNLKASPTPAIDSPATSPSVSPERLPPTIAEEGPADAASTARRGDEKRKTSILWLGSSIGNFTREEAVEFLKGIDLATGDTMLIGIDGCDNGPEIEVAYNDPKGITRAFILEGVDQAGKCLHPDLEAGKGLCSQNFEYVNRWNGEIGRHEAYIRAIDDLVVPVPAVPGSEYDATEIHLKRGELLQIEVSYKYTPAEAMALFHLAGLRLIQQWTDSSHRHSLYLVEKPSVWFPSPSASKVLGLEKEGRGKNVYGVPSLEDWEELWRAWDWLMHDIIPPSLRFNKPIPLRHVPLFYVGHAPAFRDIHLSRYFNEPLTSPAHFADIFERGIDPNVDDPSVIGHSHSEVPQTETDWPKFEEIVEYEHNVRQRVRRVYEEHEGKWERKLARVLMMVFEHEMMHHETSVYICLQACKSLNLPSGTALPDFPSLARFTARQIAHENVTLGPDARKSTVAFPAQTISVGHDDDDRIDDSTAYDPAHEYGWDCENPKREVEVGSFKIDLLPVTNGEYRAWLMGLKIDDEERKKLVPASWAVGKEGVQGRLGVKTLWGEVEMPYAEEWPVSASAEQLERFAKDKGGRLPTFPELALFLQHHPAESPSSNLGFSSLHPVPPSLPTTTRSPSPATDGGLWQWTSSTLVPWKGYVGSSLYPGYSSDFFDEKHRIVLGGSWASARRIVRRSFVNFYQGGYPFALIGARVAYDA
ncbi:hypothetical protein JCM1841_000446 [Sporobolomyces salmonicolor]